MAWYVYLAYFFAGIFAANGVPHFVNGISGRKFPSPFASPPGRGESSPLVNVLWGSANFVAAYIIVVRVGDFTLGFTRDVLMVFLGALLISAILAVNFWAQEQSLKLITPVPARRQ